MFIQALEHIRRMKGLTQKKFCAIIGVSIQHYSLLKRQSNMRAMPERRMQQIADMFKIPIAVMGILALKVDDIPEENRKMWLAYSEDAKYQLHKIFANNIENIGKAPDKQTKVDEELIDKLIEGDL